MSTKLLTQLAVIAASLFIADKIPSASAQVVQFTGGWPRSATDQQAIDAQKVILDQSMAKWAASGITNYKFVLTRECKNCNYFPNYPYQTVITPGQNMGMNKAFQAVASYSVNDIFGYFAKALLPTANGGCGKMKANYADATYGYPTDTTIVWDTNDGNTAVNWERIVISAFEVRSASPRDAYNTAQALWNSKRISNYRFSYQNTGANRQPNTNYPVTVNIVNNGYSTAVDADNQPITWFVSPTMAQFFEVVSRNVNSNAPYIDVTYGKNFLWQGSFIGVEFLWSNVSPLSPNILTATNLDATYGYPNAITTLNAANVLDMYVPIDRFSPIWFGERMEWQWNWK